MARRSMTVAELRKLLADQEKELQKLEKKRGSLLGELEGVESEIERLSGEKAVAGLRKAVAEKKPERPRKKAARQPIRTRKGKITLREALRQVLAKASSSLRVAEIVERLPETGYSSTSKNLANMVGQVLIKGEEFRRVSWGKYGPKRKSG